MAHNLLLLRTAVPQKEERTITRSAHVPNGDEVKVTFQPMVRPWTCLSARTRSQAQPSKSVQPPSMQTPAKAVARQQRKAMATVPVAKPESALPLFAEPASEDPTQPQPRKAAFKKNEGATREWKPVD